MDGPPITQAYLRPFKVKMMRLLFSSFSCVAVLEVFCFVVMSEELGEETLTMISNHDNFAPKQSKNTTAKLQIAQVDDEEVLIKIICHC